MPLSALETVEVDYVASAADLGALLANVAQSDAGVGIGPSDGLRLDVEVAAGAHLGSQALRQIAMPSPLSCPDCHGVLCEVNGGRPLRLRCQTSHAHTAETLATHVDEVDEAIAWRRA